MEFGVSDRSPRRREGVVPMINVVFLLLIFFLMTATIAPRSPFDLALPEAGDGDAALGTAPLFVSANGELSYRGIRGSEAIAAVDPAQPLEIRADAQVKGSDLAAILPRLAALGVEEIRLVTVRAP